MYILIIFKDLFSFLVIFNLMGFVFYQLNSLFDYFLIALRSSNFITSYLFLKIHLEFSFLIIYILFL
jgi:hypothetical protein